MRNCVLGLLLLFVSFNQMMAQQEFFGNSNGITISGGTNANSTSLAGLDFYLKDNIVFSGNLGTSGGVKVWGVGVGFLSNIINGAGSTKGFIGLAYAASANISNYGFNLGAIQIIQKESNFPLSISAILGLNLSGLKTRTPYTDNTQTISVNPVVSYTQAFFAKNQVYPVIGVSYHLALNEMAAWANKNSFFVSVGVNIRIDKRSKYKS